MREREREREQGVERERESYLPKPLFLFPQIPSGQHVIFLILCAPAKHNMKLFLSAQGTVVYNELFFENKTPLTQTQTGGSPSTHFRRKKEKNNMGGWGGWGR